MTRHLQGLVSRPTGSQIESREEIARAKAAEAAQAEARRLRAALADILDLAEYGMNDGRWIVGRAKAALEGE